MRMEQHTELELERMQQMLLSSHFTLGEFLRSGTAIKYGIDNTPQDAIIIIRLMMLCEQVLEPLQAQTAEVSFHLYIYSRVWHPHCCKSCSRH